MAYNLSMYRLIGFEDLFPKEPPQQKLQYGARIGKDRLCTMACHFLSFFRHRRIPNKLLLRSWFSSINPSFWYVLRNYQGMPDRDSAQHAILSVESLLNLFQWANSTKELPTEVEIEPLSSETDALRLYMLFNNDVLAKYATATNSVKQYDDNRHVQRLLLAMSFSQHDLINIDYAQLLYAQFYKSVLLLDFLYAKEDFKPLFEAFLKEFNCQSKEEFLKSISTAIVLGIKSDLPGWTILNVPRGKNFDKDCAFLENLIVKDETVFEDNDYLQLRNAPFQKIGDGQYRIIFDLFLIKKMYNGLFFKLLEVWKANKHLLKKDFTGTFRNEFSEGVLVYDTISKIYSKLNCIQITGNDF